jgi:hypothetical protein
MAEWLKDHVAVISFLNPNFRIFGSSWLNWRPGDALRWKVETTGWEGWGVYVKIWHLQGCSLRLCQLRIDGLAPAKKYWTYWSYTGDMGPVNLVACHRQKLGLSLLLHWLAWERNWVWIRGLCRESFSRKQWDPNKSVDDSWKVGHWQAGPTCRDFPNSENLTNHFSAQEK